MRARSPVAAHVASPAEVKARIEATRGGSPVLIYRDGENRQRILPLGPEASEVTIGRRATNDVALVWDRQVSRLHAQLERVGNDWTMVDAGVSSNGTFR